LSHGEKVRVLSPDVLAIRVEKRIRAMNYLYNQTVDDVGKS